MNNNSQFSDISIDSMYVYGLYNQPDFHISFPNNINIFIGPNGVGKTTIINLIESSLEVFKYLNDMNNYVPSTRFFESVSKPFNRCGIVYRIQGERVLLVIEKEKTSLWGPTMVLTRLNRSDDVQEVIEESIRYVTDPNSRRGIYDPYTTGRWFIKIQFNLEERRFRKPQKSKSDEFNNAIRTLLVPALATVRFFNSSSERTGNTVLAEVMESLYKKLSELGFGNASKSDLAANYLPGTSLSSRFREILNNQVEGFKKVLEEIVARETKYTSPDIRSNFNRSYKYIRQTLTDEEITKHLVDYYENHSEQGVNEFINMLLAVIDDSINNIPDDEKYKLYIQDFCSKIRDGLCWESMEKDVYLDIEKTASKFGLLNRLVSDKLSLEGCFRRSLCFQSNNILIKNEKWSRRQRRYTNLPTNSLSDLSSGELNYIYVLFTMLFEGLDVPGNSILTVDEPEISLHIDWQTKIVWEMIEIYQRYYMESSTQVIIITHSPFIAQDHEELITSPVYQYEQ